MQKSSRGQVVVLALVFLIAIAAGLTGLTPLVSAVGAQSVARVNVLVAFAATPGPAEQALVRGAGGEIKYSYHLVPAIAASIPEPAIAGLRAHPLVRAVEPDGEVFALDAELDNTWGVKRIGAGDVHSAGNTGSGVLVAVIDSGIDHTHADLGINYAGGYDFVNDDNDPMDDNGHGTHVAGTIAAPDDNVGVVGAAPAARVYALKVLNDQGSGAWSDIIAALQWTVDNGLQVTNNSYGSGTDPGSTVEAAFANAEALGVLHVAAAGNSGNCGGKGNSVGYPARYSSVIAVSATNQSDARPCFSSTGPDVELAAPGVAINSTIPGGAYDEFSGTSMASPHVAGTAALVLAAGIQDANANGRVNDEIRSVLTATAFDLGAAGRDPHYGFGLVDAAAAVASVGPPSPAVKVSLTTDRSTYDTAAGETTAVLTATVLDEAGAPISGLGAAAFVTLLDATAASVTFVETATTGTYTGSLDLSALTDGSHVVEVIVTDTRGVSGSAAASFSTGAAPTDPTTVSVASIVYTTDGGPDADKHLNDTVTLVDDAGAPVAGAAVSITVTNLTTGASWNGSGTTGSNGSVTVSLKNAPSGCYETAVTAVSASGLLWDGVTPANSFCK